MKNVFFWLMALMLMLASCGEEDVPASITCTTTNLTFDSSGGTQTLSFEANKKWSIAAAGGVTWCTVSPANGGADVTTVQVTAAPNETYEERNVALTIVCEDVSHTVTVVQKQKDALLLTSDRVEVDVKGGTIEIEVKSNIDYQMEISETAKDWISEATTRGLSSHKHTLTVAASEEYDKREGEIYFISGDKKETVKVYQSGAPALLLTQNEFAVGSAGETITVEIKSNFQFGVQMPDVDWIAEAPATRGMSSHTRQYVVAPSEEYDARSAELVFYDLNSGKKDTVRVVQAQKDALLLTEKDFSVAAEGGTVEVKLSTNVDFEVVIPEDATWITRAATRGLVDYTVKFNVAENTGEDSRSAEITLTNKGSGLVETITLTQVGRIVTVNLSTAGTLASTLGEIVKKARRMVITGPLNGGDIQTIRDMATTYNLVELDMSGASIITEGTYRVGDNEYSVVENTITDKMFYETNLETIILPDDVTWIGKNTFSNSSSLSKIIIPDGVTWIESLAFNGCI